MPEATQYIFSDSKTTAGRAIEDSFVAEHNKRAERINKAWRYYEGEHDLPLKVQKDGYDDNVIVNHVGNLADKLVAFMIGDGISFDAGGDGAETETDEQIRELWEQNRGDIMQNNIALSGAIEGHCTVRLVPQDNIEYPRLTRIRQGHFAAFWNPFDMSDVLWYRLQHQAGGMGRRIDYVRGAVTETGVDHSADGWLEVVYQLDKVMSGSVIDSTATWKLVSVEPWEYPFPPIVDWQNLPNPNGYYGLDDVKGAIKLNNALNFILSNIQRIIKHYAAPKTIGLGFSTGDLIETKVGGFFTVNRPKTETDIFNLEMQSDLGSSMQMAAIVAESLWQSGGMIDPQTMKDRIGQLTNFGLRVLFSDALKKTEKKRLLYSEGFEQICKYALALSGRPAPDKVVTIWPDVLPEDEGVVSNVLLQELDHGIISKQTYRAIRGYDEQEELDRLAEETAQNPNIGGSILGLLAGNNAFNRGQVG